VTVTPTASCLCMDNQRGATPAERPAAVSVDKNIYASFLKVRLSAVHPSRYISFTAVTNVIDCWLNMLALLYETKAGVLFVAHGASSVRIFVE